MSNLPAVSKLDCTNREETDLAVEKLLNLLGPERMIQLAELVTEVCQKTGWGGVDIVIAEGRVATLKQEISHK